MHTICGTHVQCMYNVWTCIYCVCTCTYNVHNVLTSCLNRFLWPPQRCRCRTEGYYSAPGGWVWGQSRHYWNGGGHQQVYLWLGEPGAFLFWQPVHIAKQAACSCRHNWQQNVACCSFGRRISSHNGWGTAKKVHAFRALIVQAHSGIQVNEYYIHVYNM